MLNHALTLLMNIDGSSAVPTETLAGDIIDRQFLALALPAPLRTIRASLFGADPDKHMLAYRSRQLLTLVHATPLEEYILALDTRVTYSHRDVDLTHDARFTPSITGSGGETPVVAGQPEVPDVSGLVFHRVQVTTDGGQTTIKRLTRPFQTTIIPTEADVPIDLPGTGLTITLADTTNGQFWTVEVHARPSRELSDVADAVGRLGEPVYNYLFGVPIAEPFRTFRELWIRKRELALRLGALVCALVYRTEVIRVDA